MDFHFMSASLRQNVQQHRVTDHKKSTTSERFDVQKAADEQKNNYGTLIISNPYSQYILPILDKNVY